MFRYRERCFSVRNTQVPTWISLLYLYHLASILQPGGLFFFHSLLPLTPWWPPPSRPLPLSYNLLDGDATLPAIVFLHGLFGSKTNFNSLAKAMVQRTGRRVSFRMGRCMGGRGLRGKAEGSGPSFNHSGLGSW